MNARAVAAWSFACLFIVLFTTNPAYKTAVLVAAFVTLATTAGIRRMRRLLIAVAVIGAFVAMLNFVSSHLGRSFRFSLSYSCSGLSGAHTLQALTFVL